jgi:hypothetical protein
VFVPDVSQSPMLIVRYLRQISLPKRACHIVESQYVAVQIRKPNAFYAYSMGRTRPIPDVGLNCDLRGLLSTRALPGPRAETPHGRHSTETLAGRCSVPNLRLAHGRGAREEAANKRGARATCTVWSILKRVEFCTQNMNFPSENMIVMGAVVRRRDRMPQRQIPTENAFVPERTNNCGCNR